MARGSIVRFAEPLGLGGGQILERMHHEIDAAIEQRELELAREESLLHLADQQRRLVEVAARGDDGDLRLPGGRGRRGAQRREHRA